MANWAVVIGVDRYWTPEACLKGAVRDALAMRGWLLDPAGGNVPPQNLTLLLSPDAASPAPGVPFTEATYDNIVLSIERMLARSGAEGDRSFFHFSGHGVQLADLSNQSVIVPSDFRPELSTKSFTVQSLFRLFQGTRFKQQFFFVDACRNLALPVELVLSDYPKRRPAVPPVSPQFVMFATQPGVQAMEVRQPGSEHGAFTGALIEGLRGAGAAKRWDEERGDYVIRWNSLFARVLGQVEALQLAALNDPGGPPLIQLPTQYGERGGEDPELGRVSADAVAKEDLEILLDPSGIQDRATIRVGEIMTPPYEHGPPATLPFKLALPPRTYGVRAEASGYAMVKRMEKVDLYAPERRTVLLVPLQPRPAETALPPPSPPAPPPPVLESTGSGAGGGGRGGQIQVHSNDPLALLELSDDAGKLIKRDRSPLVADGLRPGFYRARIVSPEGRAVEEIVDLEPAAPPVSVKLTAPKPTGKAMDWAMQKGGFEIFDDGTVGPSESVGPSAFLQLSTMLALAAGAAIEGTNGHGYKLRQLGIPTPAFANGAMVLFGDEQLDPAAWRETVVRWWADGELSPVADPIGHLSDAPGIGYALRALSPGLHWLLIGFVGRSETVIPLAVLPGRLTLVVVTRGQDGAFDIHQYQPLLDPAAAPVQPPDWKGKDPRFSESRFAQIRRIELMQRAVNRGRITPTEPDIEQLLFDKWTDPVAGCLGGYLLVRMGRANELGVPAGNLVQYFGELADAHVLMGTYREATPGAGDARPDYVLALDRGVPTYRDGLDLLASAIDRFDIDHPRAALIRTLLDTVPAGSLWSASLEAAPLLLAQLYQAAATAPVAEQIYELVEEVEQEERLKTITAGGTETEGESE